MRRSHNAALTEALAQLRLFVDEDLGGDDVAEWQKRRDEVSIAKLLRQMVDKQIAALGAFNLLVGVGEFRLLGRSRRSRRRRRERREPCNHKIRSSTEFLQPRSIVDIQLRVVLPPTSSHEIRILGTIARLRCHRILFDRRPRIISRDFLVSVAVFN